MIDAQYSPFRGLGGRNKNYKNMKNIIVGLGEILWDLLPGGKVLGGAPANFAYQTSQFGFEGYAVSAIGKDALGDEIIESLSSKSLNHKIERVDFPTGTVQVTLDGKGIPQYEICENVAWDNIPFTPEIEDLARKASTVCFGSLAQRSEVSRQTILRFLELLPHDALKVFDINLRQHFYTKEIIDNSLKHSNILKINDDEVVIVAELYGWNGLEEAEICRKLVEMYHLKLVILTKGTNGSYVITSGEEFFRPTPIVTVADTVGAGDAFTAGFVASLLRGKTIPEAHKTAVDVSAFVCTQHGAMPVLPDTLIQ